MLHVEHSERVLEIRGRFTAGPKNDDNLSRFTASNIYVRLVNYCIVTRRALTIIVMSYVRWVLIASTISSTQHLVRVSDVRWRPAVVGEVCVYDL